VPDRRYRVLLVATHVVQYASPVFREMARDPRLEIQVAYCSLQGAQRGVDPEFGREVKWDVPLLDGYPWTEVRNRAPHPGLGRFFGLLNTGLWRVIREGRFDAVVLYTGYRYASFWIALAAAKLSRTKVVFGTDASAVASRNGKSAHLGAKKIIWSLLFGLADQIIVPSSSSREMLCSLGYNPAHISLTPYVVDNDWWRDRAASVDRAAVRASWEISPDAPVVLFCAKLQPWKRPHDLLRAFAQADLAEAHLVFAGTGPLLASLEAEAAELGVRPRVHFLGFANQTQLPGIYRASDLLVLPSDYEPFGVVVNEAMLCGCTVAVSDHVGAGRDLVSAESGFIFPAGDVTSLAALIRRALSDTPNLRSMGRAARERMARWSVPDNVEAFVQALGRTVSGNSVGAGNGASP